MNRASFLSTYASPTGTFKDAKPIVAADDRQFASDISSSALFPEDLVTDLWKGDYVEIKTTSPLPANTASVDSNGIDILTANSNGSFPAIDGAGPLNSYIVSGEATLANNGVYTLIVPGNAFTPWVLQRRVDSRPGSYAGNGIYYVKFGTLNGDKYFRQEYDGVNIQFSQVSGLSKKKKRIAISTAQILNGNSVPVNLIAAPGSGYMIRVVNSIVVKFLYGSAAFATNTTFNIGYGFSATSPAITSAIGGIISQTQNYVTYQQPISNGGPTTSFDNVGIYFLVQTGNPTAGTGSSLLIEIEYEIIPTT